MSYRLKGFLVKKLKNESDEEFVLPKNVTIEKHGKTFCVVHANGTRLTQPLVAIDYEKNEFGTASRNILVCERVSGRHVKVDVEKMTKTREYIEILQGENRQLIVCADNRFYELDENFNAKALRHKLVDTIVCEGRKYFVFSGADSKPNNEEYGIYGADGTLICPKRFHNSNLTVSKLDDEFYIISSPAKNSKQVLVKPGAFVLKTKDGKTEKDAVLLCGDGISEVCSHADYIRNFEKTAVPMFAVFDKATCTSDIFAIDADNKENMFVKIGTLAGEYSDYIHCNKNNKFYYFVGVANSEETKLVSADGKVCVAAEELYDTENYTYDDLTYYEGRTCTPVGMFVDKSMQNLYLLKSQDKLGVFDTNVDKVILPAKYKKVLIVAKTKNGENRFFVENEAGNFGVVDENGKPVVSFRNMGNFVAMKQIEFDGETRCVAYIKKNTLEEKPFYVDPASETGYASDLAVSRFREVFGTKKKRKPADAAQVKEEKELGNEE